MLAADYAGGNQVISNFTTSEAFLLIIVIAVAGYIVQARLQSVFAKYSKVALPDGMTGAEIAERMLRENNIHNVRVTHVAGHLTDHFNPQTMTVNLSDSVYSGRSVSAAPWRATSADTPCSMRRDMRRWRCARLWCR